VAEAHERRRQPGSWRHDSPESLAPVELCSIDQWVRPGGILVYLCGRCGGLLRAGTVVGESTRSPLAIIAEDSVSVLEATGMGLALCTLLFVAAWAFDASAWHFTGSSRVLSAIVRLRRLLWPIAILLLAATLFEIRPTFTAVAVSGDRRVGYAIFTALGQLLSRLWLLFAAMGALTWLIVLIEGAAMRRLRPA